MPKIATTDAEGVGYSSNALIKPSSITTIATANGKSLALMNM